MNDTVALFLILIVVVAWITRNWDPDRLRGPDDDNDDDPFP